jgi:hypothetical protein
VERMIVHDVTRFSIMRSTEHKLGGV